MEDKTLTVYTQYKRDGVLYRCHPNYRGDGPWYDWVMVSYEDDNGPGGYLTGPARLIAVVIDSTDVDGTHQPIIQLSGYPTENDSVLFTEYVFDKDNVENQIETYSIHDKELMLEPIFVIDCELNTSNNVLVCHDPDTWPDKFL